MNVEISPFGEYCKLVVHEKPFRTTTHQLLMGFPGYKRWEGYAFIFAPTIANLTYATTAFPQAKWLGITQQHVIRLQQVRKEEQALLQLKDGGITESTKDKYKYLRMPRTHQREAFILSRDCPNFALLMEQRVGKTKVVIDTAAYLYQKKKLHTLVIVTLNGVHRNWIDNEVPKDLPAWCHRHTYFSRSADTKQNQKQFDDTFNYKKGLRIFAFNVEALSREGRARGLFEKVISDGKGTMLVVDESADCIKTYSAKRTKYLIRIAAKVQFKRILTGTQAPEGRPEELFSQYKFLSPDIIGYDTITTFRARYCTFNTIMIAGGRRIEVIAPGCRNLEELQQRISPYSYRCTRAQCMDLPPKIYKRWPVEMTPVQKRLYHELVDEYIAEFEGHEISAPLAITRITRLQQIVCGWWPMKEEDENSWRKVLAINKTNPRMTALDDILRTHEDRKCLIWARFKPDLRAIQEHLGPTAVSYHGGVGSEAKAANYKRFQQDPTIRYFVANQSSAGRGLNLSKATMSIYYSNSFRLADRLQSEDRSEGDEKRIDSTLVIDLETPGTIDAKIIRALKSKKDFADLINMDSKSLFLEVGEE